MPIKPKITAVIVAWNEEKTLQSCVKTLDFVNELVIVDNESTDETLKISKTLTDKVYRFKNVGYVEPVRNFAINKSSNDWILVIDPDEHVPHVLAKELLAIASEDKADYVRIPRQNLIFGNWMEHSRWWPDYNIRFFKKGCVVWQDAIHSIPVTTGRALDLPAQKDLSLTHYHYQSVDEYLTRLIRYTNQQSKELISQGYKFNALDLVTKPLSEFLSRYFAGEGYKDGLHGLAISLLQSFSELIVHLKVWQSEGFTPDKDIFYSSLFKQTLSNKIKEFRYWIYTVSMHIERSKIQKLYLKLKRKLTL